MENENDDVYSLRGYCNQQLGLYQEALDDYNMSITLQPKDHKHYSNRGLLNLKLENYRGALADYQKAIELCPTESLRYINNRGWANFKLDDLYEACVDFKYCADKGWEQAKKNYKNICQIE